MPERIDAAKITVTVRPGEPGGPVLRFLRFKVMPIENCVAEPDVHEDEGQAEPSKRTP